jgi:hypothetical protein
MACFYAMEEIGIPFQQVSIHGAVCEKIGEELLPTIQTRTSQFCDPGDREPRHNPFFTLRVCKRCRADWLTAIRDWFGADISPEPTSDVYIRHLGYTRAATAEEIDRLKARK